MHFLIMVMTKGTNRKNGKRVAPNKLIQELQSRVWLFSEQLQKINVNVVKFPQVHFE